MAFVTLLLVSPPSFGADKVVLSIEDAGPKSLRHAIAKAHSGDTISFSPLLSDQTIILTNGEINVSKAISIDASSLSNGVVISGNARSRIFNVHPEAKLTLKHVTLADGYLGGPTTNDYGAAIYSERGKVTLLSCVVSNNICRAGGGIYSLGGSLFVDDSDLTANSGSLGGAIWNDKGVAVINRCHVHSNLSDIGGGILTEGNLTINDSTISSNSVTLWGGGIASIGLVNATNVSAWGNFGYYGSGVYIYTGAVTFANCTIASNGVIIPRGDTLGAGFMHTSGHLHLIHTTVSGNLANVGGGIYNIKGTVVMENSVCAGNFAEFLVETRGSVDTSLGHNITNGNPKLAPLDFYGGFTPTMPPLPGSPLIDAAVTTSNTPPTDQRGFSRPNGIAPDIGAVEAFAFSSIPLIDTDHDGIDDRLEPGYPQFTVGVDDHELDTDGDGSPDWQELANMTDPNDSKSVFKILSFTPAPLFNAVTNPVFDVTIPTFPGLSYVVEAGDQLTNFQAVAGTSFTATNTTKTFRIQLGSTYDFLRARRQ